MSRTIARSRWMLLAVTVLAGAFVPASAQSQQPGGARPQTA